MSVQGGRVPHSAQGFLIPTMSNLMTFHKILSGCEGGIPAAWRTLLSEYTPVVLRLFGVYSPWTPERSLDAWREVLSLLSADQCLPLRSFSHQSEREFLVDLRAFLLDWMAAKLEPCQIGEDPAAPTVETLAALLKGLPLLHQEIAFLTLAGYSQGTVEKTLRITPSVAGEALDRLRANYAPVLNRSEDRCLWPSAWIGISRAARAGGQKDCAPLRLLVRVLDGQASWYDKTPVEEHRPTCLHCLELWTSLLEVVSWEREAAPWPVERIEPLLAAVPLETPKKSKTSLLARMLAPIRR